LDHQVRALRKRHDGPLDVIWDRLPGHGFYDIERVRIQGEGLWRVYELLYPRDLFTVSQAACDLLGLEHLAAIWIDRGQVRGRSGHIRWSLQDPEGIAVMQRLCARLGFPSCHPIRISFDEQVTKELVAALRPHIHVSMRRTISLRKPRYEAPKLRVLDGAIL